MARQKFLYKLSLSFVWQCLSVCLSDSLSVSSMFCAIATHLSKVSPANLCSATLSFHSLLPAKLLHKSCHNLTSPPEKWPRTKMLQVNINPSTILQLMQFNKRRSPEMADWIDQSITAVELRATSCQTHSALQGWALSLVTHNSLSSAKVAQFICRQADQRDTLTSSC